MAISEKYLIIQVFVQKNLTKINIDKIEFSLISEKRKNCIIINQTNLSLRLLESYSVLVLLVKLETFSTGENAAKNVCFFRQHNGMHMSDSLNNF